MYCLPELKSVEPFWGDTTTQRSPAPLAGQPSCQLCQHWKPGPTGCLLSMAKLIVNLKQRYESSKTKQRFYIVQNWLGASSSLFSACSLLLPPLTTANSVSKQLLEEAPHNTHYSRLAWIYQAYTRIARPCFSWSGCSWCNGQRW